MTDRLIILGAGGHAKVVAEAAMLQGRWTEVALLDETTPGTTVLGLRVIQGMRGSPELRHEFGHAAVAIGDPHKRLELLEELFGLGFSLPAIQHPSAVISTHASVGPGCVILAGSVLNAGCRLGRGCIVNTRSAVDHDCELGDGVHVAPGATLAGDVRVGRASWVGLGACVLEGRTLGADVTVGAGAAVTADVADGLTVVGVPARPVGSPAS